MPTMSDQMDLFTDIPAPKGLTRKDQIESAARAFHEENPEVWRWFCRFTRQAMSRGFKKYSAYAIFERIRWETDVPDVDGNSTFKLNNNYRPYYARWFMEQHPDAEGFFRIRALTSEDKLARNGPEQTPTDYPYTNQKGS